MSAGWASPIGASSGTAALEDQIVLPVHDVDCPKCGQRVYTAISLEDVIPADAPTVPKVSSDARGYYLRCPHCSERIGMKRVDTQGGTGFRLA